MHALSRLCYASKSIYTRDHPTPITTAPGSELSLTGLAGMDQRRASGKCPGRRATEHAPKCTRDENTQGRKGRWGPILRGCGACIRHLDNGHANRKREDPVPFGPDGIGSEISKSQNVFVLTDLSNIRQEIIIDMTIGLA